MTDEAAEIARWREKFELVDGLLTWRPDPTRSVQWRAAWEGKPTGKRVVVDGRIVSTRMIVVALASGRIDVHPSLRKPQGPRFDYDGAGLPDHVEVGGGPLATALAKAAAEAGTPRYDLAVLNKALDPFLLDTPRGHAEAHWFATHFQNLVGELRLDIRGVHDLIASVAGIRTPRGAPYVKDIDCWKWLVARAAKCARWLGYVPFDAIDDSRSTGCERSA